MRKKHAVNIILLGLLACVICYWGFGKLFAPDLEDTLSSITTYEYNPNTIIKDIGDGKKDLFTETETIIGTNYVYNNTEINEISDEDFYTIIQYLMNDTFDSEFEKWNLVEVGYNYFDCPSIKNEEAIIGFFQYEKKKTNNLNNSCIVGITTYSNDLTLKFSENNIVDQEDALEFSNLQYSASEVINLVKLTDIYSQKQIEANQCGYFSIKINGNDPYWKVKYYEGGEANDGELLISLGVNSRTGNIINYGVEE